MSYTPLGVIVIVVATLAALALFNEHKEAQTHYQAARKEYEASKQIVPPDIAARRVHTDYKAYRDEWRSEQDLESQREMARTSWWVMVATWIGVGLLILTLIEANQTTLAATEAAEHSQRSADTAERALRGLERPYLFTHLKSDNIQAASQAILKGQPLPVEAVFFIRNHGRSPAVIKFHSTRIRLLTLGEEPKPVIYVPKQWQVDDWTPIGMISADGSTDDFTAATQSFTLSTIHDQVLKRKTAAIWLISRCIYSDALGNQMLLSVDYRYSARSRWNRFILHKHTEREYTGDIPEPPKK